MKKLISLLILVFLVGCTAPQIELEEVTNESIITEIPVVVEEPVTIETDQYYNFYEGDTQEILGHSITLNTIHINPQIDLTVDYTEASIIETKNEEIIEGLKISIQKINDVYRQEKYVTLKIEELNLGKKEYIINKGESITVGNREIVLEDSKVSGYIQVSVYNKGTLIGDTENIKRGESILINELTITNLKNYYKVNQYAWIIVE